MNKIKTKNIKRRKCMKMLTRELIIDILKRMMIKYKISLKNIDRFFMKIKIKMTTQENLIKTIIRLRTNMIIKFTSQDNITSQNMEVKVIFINRDIRLGEEGIKRDTQEAIEVEDMKEEGIREVGINREGVQTLKEEDIIEELGGMTEEQDPTNLIILDLGMQIKTHLIIIMNMRKIKVSLMELKISISILPSNLKTKTKGEQYLMMKSIMKSKLKSLFKNMVNIKKTLSLIIMMKMIIMKRKIGKTLIVMSLGMIRILLIKILGKVIRIKINKKENGWLKIRMLR